MLEYGKAVIKMITLAPEICSEEIIDLIKSYGIIISAGHSNATYAEAMNAFKKDIHVATHLFNAMSALASPAARITCCDNDEFFCNGKYRCRWLSC